MRPSQSAPTVTPAKGAPRSVALRGGMFLIHPDCHSLRASQTCPRRHHLQTRLSFRLCPEGQDSWQQGPCPVSSLHKKFGLTVFLTQGTGVGTNPALCSLTSLAPTPICQWFPRPAIRSTENAPAHFQTFSLDNYPADDSLAPSTGTDIPRCVCEGAISPSTSPSWEQRS